MRTALRSLVARDIKSPVRVDWKYASGSRSRCAKNALRMSYSMARDAPIRSPRGISATKPLSDGDGKHQSAVIDQFSRSVTPALQIIDGPLEHPRPGKRDRAREDDATTAADDIVRDSGRRTAAAVGLRGPRAGELPVFADNRTSPAFWPSGLLISSRTNMHALYLVVPALGILAIAYRYYSAFIATRIWMLDDSRADAGAHQVRRRQLLPDHPMGALRAPFRRHHRRRPAGRPDAGGAVRLGARLHLAGRRRVPRRRRPRLDDPVGLDPARRQVAAPTWSRSRSARSPASSPSFAILFILVVALAGLGIVVVNALADSAWGTFTIAMTIPIGMFMGLWMYVWRKGRIAEATVIGVIAMLAGGGRRRAAQPSRTRGSAASSTCRAPQLVHRAVRLRLRRLGAAGVAAAVAARLPELVHEDRHDPAARVRRHDRQPRAADAGAHRVRRRRRADHSRTALPLLLRHHRLRRHLGLPRAHQLGHDLEDDRQGDATSGRSATARC